MKEIWKPILDFEGIYIASNLGKVKRIKPSSGTRCQLLKHNKTSNGYVTVTLIEKKKKKIIFVHRLICETFIGPCPQGHVTNHKNGNKENNKVSNLEWVTHYENIRHACDVLKVNCKKWIVISPKGKRIKIHNLQKFCREKGWPGSGNLINVADGKLSHYKNWKCERV